MDANIPFSPEAVASIERRISLYPSSVVTEILGRLDPTGSNKIVPTVFHASGEKGFLYAIVPNVSLSSGPGGWKEALTAGGYSEEDLFRALAKKLCASFIPSMAQQPYEVMACLEVKTANRPDAYYKLGLQSAVTALAVAAPKAA